MTTQNKTWYEYWVVKTNRLAPSFAAVLLRQPIVKVSTYIKAYSIFDLATKLSNIGLQTRQRRENRLTTNRQREILRKISRAQEIPSDYFGESLVISLGDSEAYVKQELSTYCQQPNGCENCDKVSSCAGKIVDHGP